MAPDPAQPPADPRGGPLPSTQLRQLCWDLVRELAIHDLAIEQLHRIGRTDVATAIEAAVNQVREAHGHVEFRPEVLRAHGLGGVDDAADSGLGVREIEVWEATWLELGLEEVPPIVSSMDAATRLEETAQGWRDEHVQAAFGRYVKTIVDKLHDEAAPDVLDTAVGRAVLTASDTFTQVAEPTTWPNVDRRGTRPPAAIEEADAALRAANEDLHAINQHLDTQPAADLTTNVDPTPSPPPDVGPEPGSP